jgi:hypothetical protein
MDLMKIGWEGVVWIKATQNIVWWRDVVNTVITNLEVPSNSVNFLPKEASIQNN